MATQVLLVDDFDHDTRADHTLVFAFDGETYSVDLSDENAAEFRELMAPYINVATRLGKHRPEKNPVNGKRPSPALARPSMPSTTNGKPWYKSEPGGPAETEKAKKRYRNMARDWGRENGYDIGDRGVIRDEVYVAFEEHRLAKGLPVGPASVGLS
ncbi:histone-like nucleoid-structuring protein Lsr2 [Saccharopolyspora phatthalungensis]|uniref:Lsr2 dimerization domain-containing protein n=1 Tax=Saccharopolyspora phatthalungensis TaxID=664693 RepID=A0A840Q4X1_9PSEU|nr:Lsr2 family protein [Saccharopolyspora phatthalungensis]MBB5154940.1 hypothetical protein [Saccharopolyspora phatthalungensis]